MAIVEEQFIQINLWCRPLARTRYSFDDVRKVKVHPRSDGTITLLATMREKERKEKEASKMLQRSSVHDPVHDEYTKSLSEFSSVYAGFSKAEIASAVEEEIEEQESEAEKPKKQRLRRLRTKVANAVFDYSEIEQEKIEEEINALVNADGYYDEIEPEDADEDYETESPINKTVILLVFVLIVFLAASGLYFHFLF